MNQIEKSNPSIGLPAMVDRATRALSGARDSAEIMEARELAKMALAYAKLTKAANETHADCLRIIVRAETRMAQEVTAAQQAGEVATVGQPESITREPGNTSEPDPVPAAATPEPPVAPAAPVDPASYTIWPEHQEPPEPPPQAPAPPVAPPPPATLVEIGVSSQRLAEWRKRAEHPDAVERGIETALQEGRAPTHADINRAIASQTNTRGTQGTGENEWYTPNQYIEAARQCFGGTIDLDPATSEFAQATIRAERYFTVEHDGLNQEWLGSVWLNPPYAQPLINDFILKLIIEFGSGRAKQAIMLTHNYTDSAWFHEAMGSADAVCFTRGRVQFYNHNGDRAAPTQGQAFFYFGKNVEQFCDAFRAFGFIVLPWRS